MVDRQIAARGIRDPRVLGALRVVPRHWFVPADHARAAYDDYPLPIGFDQTISQPYIVAVMTEALATKPADRVLEIGTGSGYQAAVLSELVERVYTIEIVEPLARQTVRRLRDRGYANVDVRIGDGFAGWPEAAPFDGIIVTCAAPEPPPALLQQLATGGRMVIPIGPAFGDQDLVRLTRRADGTFARDNLGPVAFVPMTGEAQHRRP